MGELSHLFMTVVNINIRQKWLSFPKALVLLNGEQEAIPWTELFKDTEVRALTENVVLFMSESAGLEHNAWNSKVFNNVSSKLL